MLAPNRDALVKALYDNQVGGRYYMERDDAEEIADTLLASGAVFGVAALLDDEVVVEKIEHDIHAMEAVEVDPSVERYAYTALHAVVAALATDG